MNTFALPARMSRMSSRSRELHMRHVDTPMPEAKEASGPNADEEAEDLEARKRPLLSEIEDANRRRQSVAEEISDQMHAKIDLENIIENEKDIIQFIDKSYEIIRENWLGDVEYMPGSIYSLAAFGLLFSRLPKNPCSPLGQQAYIKCCGLIVIWLIQAIAPPAIFLDTIFGLGGPVIDWYKWRLDFDDWHHFPVSKALSIIFMEGFLLNSIYVILDERKAWKQIDSIFTYFQRKTPSIVLPGENFLYLGAITNCWVVFWCCIDTVVVLGAAHCPKDVVFDSLGLLFLFNLDDIGGDLGFVDEDDWPGHRLGWIYENMVPKKEEEMEFDWQSKATVWVYKLTLQSLYLMTLVLPGFVAMTSFSKLVPSS